MTKMKHLISADGTANPHGFEDLTRKAKAMVFSPDDHQYSKQEVIDTASSCFNLGLISLSKQIIVSHPDIDFIHDDEHFEEIKASIRSLGPVGDLLLASLGVK